MTPEFWIQLATLLLGGAGVMGTVYGVLNNRITKVADKLHGRVDAAEAAVAEVRRDYVRRDDLRDDIRDLKDDMSRLERGQENTAADIKQMTSNVLPVLARIAEAAATISAAKRE
jgi:hypothetical protein